MRSSNHHSRRLGVLLYDRLDNPISQALSFDKLNKYVAHYTMNNDAYFPTVDHNDHISFPGPF